VKKIRDCFRFQILLIARRAGLIQQLLSGRMPTLCGGLRAEVVVDVDPVNLM